ncbi:sensor histidine kinase [Solitalea koreensis]|uniref:histidine kinase n=1 Tax=Solitalea koreensis TaxID=543615 RepID=A0A521ADL6_9SPHI|nr:ATP-binding protein [Solitalea koreensis]SMO32889.1 PAS/PAC sensor signal transduction histidine kinase [Solitalea koreensis]
MTNEQLRILTDTIQQLSLARNIDTIMEIVRKSARTLTGADGATFVLRDRDLCYYADEDAIEPLWKGHRFPMKICISGWSMLNRQPAVIEDIYVDERIPIEAYKPTFVKSLAMVPIRTVNPIGAIGNYWGTKHAPTTEEVHLLQTLADITSVSVENVYVYSELEERVKLRTKELEFAYKELETFSYSVSHDLRSPLNNIRYLIQLLKDEDVDTSNIDGKELLEAINSSAERMSNLIDDLLSLSKFSKKKIIKTAVDMNELTRNVLNDIEKSKVNSVDIQLENLHTIEADYNLMYQVMFNLISNAIKYSSKKENPQVKISSVEQNGEIIFSVKDNGAGFDMKYVEKLFQPFQRFHSQSDFEGSGIGLSLAQRIINRHGGTIWAEAEVGEGANFHFSLKSQYCNNNELILKEMTKVYSVV